MSWYSWSVWSEKVSCPLGFTISKSTPKGMLSIPRKIRFSLWEMLQKWLSSKMGIQFSSFFGYFQVI
jgi:hypothetical protein